MTLLDRLDAFGFDDPDNREGQPEDICTVCFGDRRVVDHPGHEIAGIGGRSAKWPHRRAALIGLAAEALVRKIDRALLHLHWHM